MKSLTKIAATVGPACEDSKVLKKMIMAGVDIFRCNLKHNDIDWHKRIIRNVHQIGLKLGRNVGVMIDLQGPELRLLTKDGMDLEVLKGDEICLGDAFVNGQKSIVLSKRGLTKDIKTGQRIFVDSGLFEFRVIFSKDGLVILKSYQDCLIKNGKSLALPGFENLLPAMTRDDFSNLTDFAKLPIDYICLSFVRNKEDVEKIRQAMDSKKIRALVVSKIECQSALTNLAEIIEVSDGVMVARGDLGVEVPVREIAYWQKEIIQKCRLKSRPVIVATQIMESMIDRARPTRAEVSDVANAVFDGADCLMLSGETAVGRYPVRVISYMKSICQFIETKRSVDGLDRNHSDVGDLVVGSVKNLVINSGDIKMDKILVFSQTGKTARRISSYRLGLPIVGVTDSRLAIKVMLLSYSLFPYYAKFDNSKFDVGGNIINDLVRKKLLRKGDRVIVVHGQNWMVSSSTNEVGVFEV